MGNQGWYGFWQLTIHTISVKQLHYAQSQVYSMVGLDHLMRDNAQKVRKQVEMAYLDPDVFSPDKTDLQQELDLGSTIIDF